MKQPIKFFKWALLPLLMCGFSSHSLLINGDRVVDGSTLTYQSAAWQSQMTEDGLVALYTFDGSGNTFADTSGYGSALNLIIDSNSTTNGVERVNMTCPGVGGTCNAIDLKFASLVRSSGPASKITSACKASNEFTVETWIENENDGQLIPENPMRRIVSMSTEVDGSNNAGLSAKHPNFFLSLVYNDGSLYRTAVRTEASEQGGVMIDSGPDQVLWSGDPKPQPALQHIIFSKDASGVARLFISYYDDDGNIIDALRREINNLDELQDGTLAAWNDGAYLNIGNEYSFANNNSELKRLEGQDDDEEPGGTTTEDQNPWLGTMHQLAVYCKAHTPEDVLGNTAPGQPIYQSFSINPNMTVSEEMQKAALLYKRLAGVSTSLANPVIALMASDIAAGDLMAAAGRVTDPNNTSDFYNVTIRDFAARMSTREETVNTPMNDFIATIIGIARDDRNAKQMLTGNFLYQADLTQAAVPGNRLNDMILSNNHYQALEDGRFDVQKVIKPVSPQVLYDGNGNLGNHPDAAGVLTSRAWMEAHATAGTNRRLVEYTFRQFLCVPLEQWADSTAPDNYVGRDIDRKPGGDPQKYATTCRTCHSVMDPLRSAFAFYDFSNGYVKHTYRVSPTTDDMSEDPASVIVFPGTSVVRKMNHNESTFDKGHMIEDHSWKNYATSASNTAYFGWEGNLEGNGVKDFGQMIADAKAFPFCMAQRAFRSACKREPVSIDKPILESASAAFIASGYSLKTLFQTIAISDECLGEEL